MKPVASFPYLHVRLSLGPDISFGPGKAELLEHIAATGSISAAARAMHMSYKRAWQLVDEMNRAFRNPLIDTSTGGARGGGATLTDAGKRIVTAYRALPKKVDAAAKNDLATLA